MFPAIILILVVLIQSLEGVSWVSYSLNHWSVSDKFATHKAHGTLFTMVYVDTVCPISSSYLDFTTNLVTVKTEGNLEAIVGIIDPRCTDDLTAAVNETPGSLEIPVYCNNHLGFGYNSKTGHIQTPLYLEEDYNDNPWWGKNILIRTYVDFNRKTIGWYRDGVYQGVAYDDVNFAQDMTEGVLAAYGMAASIDATIELTEFHCELPPIKWVSPNNLWYTGNHIATHWKDGGIDWKTVYLNHKCFYPPAKVLDFTIKIINQIGDNGDGNYFVGIADSRCPESGDNIGHEYLSVASDYCLDTTYRSGWALHPNGYVYTVQNGAQIGKQYATSWYNTLATIRTFVDLELGSIMWYINGSPQGWAYRGINFKTDLTVNPAHFPEGIRAAFSVSGDDQVSIQLLEYKCE